ncbi:MAG: hypothetical protein ACK4MV_10735 [Beijerinckiaceae bacterium]
MKHVSEAGARRKGRFLVLSGGVGLAGSWLLLLVAVLAPDSLQFETVSSFALARFNFITLAQSAILTSIGLILAGMIRKGVDALRVLSDYISNRPAMSPVADMPSQFPAADVGSVSLIGDDPVRAGMPREVKSSAERAADLFPGRRYEIHADGTIEIDTLLGARRFRSYEEASLFVGLGSPRQLAA